MLGVPLCKDTAAAADAAADAHAVPVARGPAPAGPRGRQVLVHGWPALPDVGLRDRSRRVRRSVLLVRRADRIPVGVRCDMRVDERF